MAACRPSPPGPPLLLALAMVVAAAAAAVTAANATASARVVTAALENFAETELLVRADNLIVEAAPGNRSEGRGLGARRFDLREHVRAHEGRGCWTPLAATALTAGG